MGEAIQVEESDLGYITITLNRPEKRNAVSRVMTKELHSALDEIKQNANLKFIVLTGAGHHAFCSGGDLKELHGEMSTEDAFVLLSEMKEVLYELATLPIPTICLLNGDARGGGCELATSCDFRIARKHTKHGFVQGKLGITPGWGGGALLYNRIHPTDAFHWLTLSQVYETDYLEKIGWVQSVIAEEDFYNREVLLKGFIEKNSEQLRVFKKQRLHQLRPNLLSEMNEEVQACSMLWESPEHKLAVEQFFRKNKKNRC